MGELLKEESIEDHTDEMPRFFAAIADRLDRGRTEYGNVARADVLAEVMQEIEDICGWSYLLWRRVKKLRERIAEIDGRI